MFSDSLGSTRSILSRRPRPNSVSRWRILLVAIFLSLFIYWFRIIGLAKGRKWSMAKFRSLLIDSVLKNRFYGADQTPATGGGFLFVFLMAFSVSVFISTEAGANEKRVQGRAFVSQISPEAPEFKNEFIKNGIPDLGVYLRTGADFTYPVLDYLDLGFRYENIEATGPYFFSSTGIKTSKATMRSLQFLARIPIVKVSFFRFDVFGSYGLNSSDVEFASSTQSTKVSGGGMWHPEDAESSSYGASVAVGYNGYYFYAEAGRSININRSLVKTGTLVTTYNKFDLSADYIAFGFIYDGDMKVGKK